MPARIQNIRRDSRDKTRIDFDINSDVLAESEGMEFGDWIDAGTRSNGYASGGLIEQPAYMIESIIRDWLHRENDLIASAVDLVNNTIDFNGSTGALLNSEDDYYNGAYIHSAKTNWTKEVTDYDGTNKRISVAALTAGEMEAVATDNKLFITNINCSIDEDTFDAVGNSTGTGDRDGWIFNGSIFEATPSEDILETMLFESHCILTKQYNTYKLFALDQGGTVGTLTSPLRVMGRPQVFVSLSSLENVYNDFKLNYLFDYAVDTPRRVILVNEFGANVSGVSTQETACKDARINHKVQRDYIGDLLYITDETTAKNLAIKLVNLHTDRYLIIDWLGDIKEHITYEIGDQVLINYSHMIPTGKNNSAKFMVTGKRLKMLPRGEWGVNLRLTELP